MKQLLVVIAMTIAPHAAKADQAEIDKAVRLLALSIYCNIGNKAHNEEYLQDVLRRNGHDTFAEAGMLMMKSALETAKSDMNNLQLAAACAKMIVQR